MKNRLWMTTVAYAAPTTSLLVGLLLTYGAANGASTLSRDGRQRQLKAGLESAATEVALRLDDLSDGFGWMAHTPAGQTRSTMWARYSSRK